MEWAPAQSHLGSRRPRLRGTAAFNRELEICTYRGWLNWDILAQDLE